MTTRKPIHLKNVVFDCHVSFQWGEIEKKINIQALRVKSIMLKAGNFRSWNPIHKLVRRRCHEWQRNQQHQVLQRYCFVKIVNRASGYLQPSEKSVWKTILIGNHAEIMQKSCFFQGISTNSTHDINRTIPKCWQSDLDLQVMATLASHLRHGPSLLGAPKVHSTGAKNEHGGMWP